MITSEWPTQGAPLAVPFLVDQVEHLRNAGVDVEVFHFRGKKNPLNYLYAWSQVQNKLVNEEYDLIHGQWGQSGLLAILPKRRPVVTTFRGDDVQGIVDNHGNNTFAGRVLQTITRLVARYTDQAIVVSEHMTLSLPRRDYHVIPSGIDLDLFQPMTQLKAREILGLTHNHPIIFFGGNPDIPNKRFNLACKAVEIVKRHIPNLHFIVAKGIAHRMMPAHLNAADVLLLTSAREGSPNVIKEALACNLPIVSTDVGDVQKRVGQVDGCLVCNSAEPESIATSLLKVLVYRQRIKGRAAVLDLDMNLLTHNVIDVYKSALLAGKS